jgi:hypothetical protein
VLTFRSVFDIQKQCWYIDVCPFGQEETVPPLKSPPLTERTNGRRCESCRLPKELGERLPTYHSGKAGSDLSGNDRSELKSLVKSDVLSYSPNGRKFWLSAAWSLKIGAADRSEPGSFRTDFLNHSIRDRRQ